MSPNCKKWSARILLFVLWIVTSVPVGGLVLSVKEALGINIFTSTGYHAFTTCLKQEAAKALKEEARQQTGKDKNGA